LNVSLVTLVKQNQIKSNQIKSNHSQELEKHNKAKQNEINNIPCFCKVLIGTFGMGWHDIH